MFSNVTSLKYFYAKCYAIVLCVSAVQYLPYFWASCYDRLLVGYWWFGWQRAPVLWRCVFITAGGQIMSGEQQSRYVQEFVIIAQLELLNCRRSTSVSRWRVVCLVWSHRTLHGIRLALVPLHASIHSAIFHRFVCQQQQHVKRASCLCTSKSINRGIVQGSVPKSKLYTGIVRRLGPTLD